MDCDQKSACEVAVFDCRHIDKFSMPFLTSNHPLRIRLVLVAGGSEEQRKLECRLVQLDVPVFSRIHSANSKKQSDFILSI